VSAFYAAYRLLCGGIVVGFPIGVLFGVLLGPSRVSGVDFRQWFWDPAQTSEWEDDSWIGSVRRAAHYLFLSAVLSLFAASAWLQFCRSCVQHHPSGVLDLFADCAGFWVRWHDLLGIGFGIFAGQAAAELAWRAGFAWLPALPALVIAQSPQRIHSPKRASTRGRRLIVCCDGTWNWPAPSRETNVVRLARAIKPVTSARISQIVHYHLGVGTGNLFDRILGGGAGVGLSNSVKSCYGFLVDNYEPGDEIFLFGFSRGAYVVRSVAGLISLVGILRKCEMNRFFDVWDWYTDRDGRDPGELCCFAPDRFQPSEIEIECIGVWDTVGALGIPGTRFCARNFTFHETALSKRVRHAFQALAIDEQRGNFQAAVWVPAQGAPPSQVLEQVWFPGAHSNIGGGYEDHGLSDTTMLWMVSEILHYDLLDLDINSIVTSLDQSEPYPNGTLENSRTLSWKLLGCPVPRPVGTASDYSSIYESAWNRSESVDPALTGDIYRSERRRTWLNELNNAKFERAQFEINYAVTSIGAKAPPARHKSSKLTWCDKLMQFIGGSA
jgi:Uncharacterized alpha/beta hydrolase domain (DUF2235)